MLFICTLCTLLYFICLGTGLVASLVYRVPVQITWTILDESNISIAMYV